jgi:hypothetical protein
MHTRLAYIIPIKIQVYNYEVYENKIIRNNSTNTEPSLVEKHFHCMFTLNLFVNSSSLGASSSVSYRGNRHRKQQCRTSPICNYTILGKQLEVMIA